MPQRKCTKTKVNVTRACKRITLPIEWELYKQLVGDDQLFRSHLDQLEFRVQLGLNFIGP